MHSFSLVGVIKIYRYQINLIHILRNEFGEKLARKNDFREYLNFYALDMAVPYCKFTIQSNNLAYLRLGSFNSSVMDTPNASAIRSMLRIEIFRSPRSTELM